MILVRQLFRRAISVDTSIAVSDRTAPSVSASLIDFYQTPATSSVTLHLRLTTRGARFAESSSAFIVHNSDTKFHRLDVLKYQFIDLLLSASKITLINCRHDRLAASNPAQ